MQVESQDIVSLSAAMAAAAASDIVPLSAQHKLSAEAETEAARQAAEEGLAEAARQAAPPQEGLAGPAVTARVSSRNWIAGWMDGWIGDMVLASTRHDETEAARLSQAELASAKTEAQAELGLAQADSEIASAICQAEIASAKAEARSEASEARKALLEASEARRTSQAALEDRTQIYKLLERAKAEVAEAQTERESLTFSLSQAMTEVIEARAETREAKAAAAERIEEAEAKAAAWLALEMRSGDCGHATESDDAHAAALDLMRTEAMQHKSQADANHQLARNMADGLTAEINEFELCLQRAKTIVDSSQTRLWMSM